MPWNGFLTLELVLILAGVAATFCDWYGQFPVYSKDTEAEWTGGEDQKDENPMSPFKSEAHFLTKHLFILKLS